VRDSFDLIAGVSTGGVLACMLGAGYTPKDIVSYYLQKGPGIFTASLVARCRRSGAGWA
jgi:patatin-like phospholipase/acyl hydrolase